MSVNPRFIKIQCLIKRKASIAVRPNVIFVTFYRPQRSWAKVLFLHLSVILLTGGVVVWSRGDLQFFGGGLQFLGGLQFFGGSPIFREVSNFGGRGWGSPIFGGFSNFSGGLQFLGGCLQFFGGVSNFFGGLSNFSGGVVQFFGGSPIFLVGVSPIFWGGCLQIFFSEMVNARPVRILLECILVSVVFPVENTCRLSNFSDQSYFR